MSTSPAARHRAEVTKTRALTVIAKTVGQNAGGMGRQAAVIAAASGLVLSSGIAANAAENGVQREAATASLDVQSSVPAVITAASSISITFERPVVTTTAATVVAEPAPAPAEVKDVEEEAPAAPVPRQAATASSATDVKSSPAPAAASTGVNSTILAAAYAQIGVTQDCTMLVTNSLAAAGIHFHDWPAGYLSLGRTVSAAEAQPGDVVYYADGGAGVAHVAVYAGNGMAVHGGYNGNQTVLFNVNVGSGPVFIRVNG